MDTCPSDEELNGFLSGSDAGAIGPHLRACARCQEALDRLSDDGTLSPASGLSGDSAWDWGDPDEISPIVQALCNQILVDRCREPFANGTRGPFLRNPARASGIPARLGAYDIEAEIGRGGMGIVYRARDRTTGRLVAVKVVFAGNDDERTRRRFVQEVRAAAKVEHDHIVRLYATSDPADEIPYFVMEYLPGPSLAAEIANRGRIPPREAAELVAQAALGIEAAHKAGLVHSDVKPANILLDPATGRAKVGDFGLARVESESPGLSREGLLPGTPAYLSPEQVRGETKPDPRSDIYSLGVTLYECLTGEPPFRGEPHRIIQQVLSDEPKSPRVFNDAIPRDLETICLKAMNKEAPRRYDTAARLADDLRHFLNGAPIMARPAGSVERLWRWCRNNRRIAALTALVSLLLIALTAGSLGASILIYRARSRAIVNAHHAEVQRGLALDALTSLIQGIQDQLATRPGTLELRRSLLEIARGGLSRLPSTESVPMNGEVDDKTIQALIKLGDIDFVLGRTADARAEFDQAARLAERVSSADPKSVPLRRQLGAAYDRVADEMSHAYTVSKEEGEYREKSLAIRRVLFALHPDNPAIRRDLRVSQNKLARYRAKMGDNDAARKLYEQSLESLKAEPVTAKNRAEILSDLRFSLSHIAMVASNQVRSPEALAAFRESLATAKELCAIDPRNVSYLRQLGFAYDYLGSACLEYGEPDEAEAAFIAFRDNRQAAVDADPADQDARRSLALAYQHLGDLAAYRRDINGARASYEQALTRFEEIARRAPTSIMAHKDRLLACRKLSSLEAFAGRYQVAATWIDRELKAQNEKGSPQYPERAGWIKEASLYRKIYGLADRCIDNPALARAQPHDIAVAVLALRAVHLARSGRAALAADAAGELLALPDAPQVCVSAARAYALAAASLDKSQSDARNSHIKSAVAAIRQTLANTKLKAALFPFDPDFKVLRDDPDFIALTHP